MLTIIIQWLWQRWWWWWIWWCMLNGIKNKTRLVLLDYMRFFFFAFQIFPLMELRWLTWNCLCIIRMSCVIKEVQLMLTSIENFWINMASKKFYSLSKQVKKVKFWCHLGYFSLKNYATSKLKIDLKFMSKSNYSSRANQWCNQHISMFTHLDFRVFQRWRGMRIIFVIIPFKLWSFVKSRRRIVLTCRLHHWLALEL